MDSFFTRFKNPLVLIAILLVQVIALAIQIPARTRSLETGAVSDGHKVTLLRQWTVAVVTPFERVLHGTSQHVRGAWNDYIDLRHTRQQNQDLKQYVARLREEQAAFAEDAAQGRRLQKLLAFQQQYIATTVAAQVIGTSGSDRSRVLYIDKGSADGLKPEQPVITPDGIVGKLRDVFPHTAQVLLIDDPTSGAGVILASTRIRAILRGNATGDVMINNLTSDSRIKPGEKVITSGGDMVFPRGLPVGEIVSIAPDPQHQPYTQIFIKPYANLVQLAEVLIVTSTQSTLTPSAAQDAATAEATAAQIAEQKKTAAEMVADKLPSLHEDAANGATGSTGSTGSTGDMNNLPLPKPKPTLHSDKYSPGATPSAEDLKPGAATQQEPAQPPASTPSPQ
jgi:rod shape-determining protein MreC